MQVLSTCQMNLLQLPLQFQQLLQQALDQQAQQRAYKFKTHCPGNTVLYVQVIPYYVI